MKRSNTKGKLGEREAAKKLNDLFPGIDAKRGINQARTGLEGCDIETSTQLHIEVKRRKRVSVNDAINQAVNDAASTGNIPCAITREDHKEWLFHCRLDDLPAIVRELKSIEGK